MFDIFIDYNTQYTLLEGSHNPGLVAISILVAIISSMMGLQIAGMARIAQGRVLRQIALASGSLALGGGIWSMHFIGMLAFQLGTHVHYQPFITLLSMCPSVLASWVALHMLSHSSISRRQLVIGGVLVGSGIGAMHYSGMAAMHMSATLRYDPLWFGASIIVAVVMAMLALWVRFGLHNHGKLSTTRATLIGGIIMGFAIAAMHYTGMAAARFIGTPDAHFAADNSHTFLAIIISAMTVAISLLVIAGNLILRYRQLYRHSLKIESELSSREQQYRTLITNIPGVAFRAQADAPWSVIFISDAIQTLSGWETEKFFSCEINLGDIIHPDDVERISQEIAPALENKTAYVIEYRIIRRDQSERWVSESASGVYSDKGKLMWIDGVIIDITESKLRNAEFEGVVHAISHALAVVEFDMNGYIIDANENFLALTGYELKELYGKHHSILCRPEDIESNDYKHFWGELRKGIFQSGEFLRLGKGKKEIWIQAAYNPIFNADGKPWKVVKLATDLSERKTMETDLLIAKDRAEQASSAKGMFLANMSHEIRTPMNAIIGFTELLLDSPLQADQLRHLQTVNRSARSLLMLLNDILDTAKLERGALELDVKAFSLRNTAQEIINELHLQAEKKGLELNIHFVAGTRDLVMGDEMRLRQVLINLLGNAIKFTQQGSVTLEISEDGDRVIIKVSDTGIGIAADRIQHIFTPFTQADASMARRFGGTGLGTTIARQLTELMGGTISATSELGKGSCFEISIPLPATRAIKKAPTTTTITLPILQILIADDVPQNIEVLQLMLTRAGHRTITANNGTEAFEQFKKHAFDMVLMDIQMPEVDGLQACRMIRQWEQAQGAAATPIIALTASVLEQDRKDAKAAGMNGFASKPIVLHELYNEIARCLGLVHPQKDTSVAAESRSAIIDWENAEQRWGNRSLLTKAIQRFCADNTKPDAFFMSPENSVELEKTKQEAHRIKGAAANLGLIALVQITQQLEQKNAADTQLFADVYAAFNSITNELKKTAPDTTAQDMHEKHWDRALLEKLLQAYTHGTFNDDAYRQLANSHTSAVLAPLNEALDQFDFDAAIAIVQTWIDTCTSDHEV